MNEDETFVVVERRGRRKAIIVSILAFLAAGGLGALSWLLWKDLEAARAESQKLAGEKKTLSDALELHRAAQVDLDGKLSRCNEDLSTEKITSAETDKKRIDSETDLTACRSGMKDLGREAAESKELLAELKGLTARFQKMIDSGKLDVTFRRGQMVVKLPAAILFPSGSAELSEEGRTALAEVAGILRQLPGRRYTVAGHTDNVPVVTSAFHDNWELSAARAVTVIKLLVSKGMLAGNLVAAGYGEYDPISSNGSPRGRQKNRRIEIILEPNLKKLALPVAATARR